ncbi:uncharacterized protein ACBT57_011656 isoform 1-T1 [Dama dama]
MRGRRLSPPAPARGPEVFRRPAAWPEVLAVRHLGDLLQTDKKEISSYTFSTPFSKYQGKQFLEHMKSSILFKVEQVKQVEQVEQVETSGTSQTRLGSQDKCSQLK